ncbi:protein sco1 [Lasallia pustulata]|uniref:Protein sco1 n=1 Tax=Lasallia pustulata TaxID=136370 RepID=A0A1W5D553_9LECA|nr:protein sco1 [Lasallia pustulata]
MARMIDLVSGSSPAESAPTAVSSNPSTSTPSPTAGPSFPGKLLPIFITCDPARDTPAVLKSYLAEFHPAMVGLTGTWEQVKAVCKAYRVYFSTPPNVKPGQDYLVDHSIYFYLMDPEGDFVEAIGRQHSAEQAARIIKEHMGDWRDGVKKSPIEAADKYSRVLSPADEQRPVVRSRKVRFRELDPEITGGPPENGEKLEIDPNVDENTLKMLSGNPLSSGEPEIEPNVNENTLELRFGGGYKVGNTAALRSGTWNSRKVPGEHVG